MTMSEKSSTKAASLRGKHSLNLLSRAGLYKPVSFRAGRALRDHLAHPFEEMVNWDPKGEGTCSPGHKNLVSGWMLSLFDHLQGISKDHQHINLQISIPAFQQGSFTYKHTFSSWDAPAFWLAIAQKEWRAGVEFLISKDPLPPGPIF